MTLLLTTFPAWMEKKQEYLAKSVALMSAFGGVEQVS